ncbi:MAG: hypothetical protein R3B96_07180 [Pirellulaceae bacterium]
MNWTDGDAAEMAGNGERTLLVKVPAYGLAAFSSSSDLRLERHESEVPDSILLDLQRDLDSLLSCVNELGAESAQRVDLDNDDFELPLSSTGVPAWITSERGVSVEAVADAHRGKQVLRLRSDGAVAWARSRILPAPRSGRLSLKVMVRRREGSPQPALRLSLEAQTPDGGYYQFAQIGADNEGEGAEIGTAWTPFAVHFDDLPCDSLRDLRVGFDLMGAGDVEVDGLEVLDGWFDEGDQRVLYQRISVARLQLQEGNALGPYRLLQSYWARVIFATAANHDALASAADDSASGQANVPAVSSVTPEEEAPRASRSVLERVRDFVPAPRVMR